jgi:putative holliday junction resolvase
MRYLAIDFGLRRLGLAVSDESGTLALPRDTIERRGGGRDVAAVVAAVRGLAQDGPVGVVLGLPRRAEGEGVHHEAEARAFAAALEAGLRRAGLTIQIEWWDERFSTREALNQMREAGIAQRHGREGGAGGIDARAAAVILQGFLDARAARQTAKTDEKTDQKRNV